MSYPSIYAIETVLGCNLRCVECAVGGGLVRRKQGLMRLAQFDHILDKIKAHARYIYLHLWGEPMLNPDIFEMIVHASRYARTNISTNGNIVDNAMAKKLVASGVDEVIVSIDGVTQDVYEQYRRRGNATKAFQALLHIYKHMVLQGKHIQLTPQFIVFEHNYHQMDDFREACGKIGLVPVFKAPYLREGTALREGPYAEFIRQKAQTPEERKVAMQGCNLNNVTDILLDGSVTACCYDHDGATTFGNIFEQDMESIWDSPRYQEFRQRVASGESTDFCMKNCLLY